MNSKENTFLFGNMCCVLMLPGVYFKILGSESSSQMCDDPVDTSKPLDILEEEELERISGLLQRDNLVRGLGIVEHVYRLLHCTPGTMGVLKTDTRSLPPPLVSKPLYHINLWLSSRFQFTPLFYFFVLCYVYKQLLHRQVHIQTNTIVTRPGSQVKCMPVSLPTITVQYGCIIPLMFVVV